MPSPTGGRSAARSTGTSSVIGSAVSSAMLRPATVTARDSGRSRVPPQTGQGPVSTYCSTRRRSVGLDVFASVCMT